MSLDVDAESLDAAQRRGRYATGLLVVGAWMLAGVAMPFLLGIAGHFVGVPKPWAMGLATMAPFNGMAGVGLLLMLQARVERGAPALSERPAQVLSAYGIVAAPGVLGAFASLALTGLDAAGGAVTVLAMAAGCATAVFLMRARRRPRERVG